MDKVKMVERRFRASLENGVFVGSCPRCGKHWASDGVKLFNFCEHLSHIDDGVWVSREEITKKQSVTVKLPLTADVHGELERRAGELGIKLNAYIQMILGAHAQAKDTHLLREAR